MNLNLLSALLFATIIGITPTTSSAADLIPSNLPTMPTDSFIAESLTHEFPTDVVLGYAPYVGTKQMGKIKFNTVRRLPQPNFLHKHIILKVTVLGYALMRLSSIPPSGTTDGIYAYDGKELLHLDGPDAKKNVSTVFRTENLQLSQIDPIELSDLLIRTVLPGYGLETVLKSSDDLRKCADIYHSQYKCPIDHSKLDKSINSVSAPCIKGRDKQGWTMRVWSLCYSGGCLVQVPSLVEYTIAISPQFEFTYQKNNLGNAF